MQGEIERCVGNERRIEIATDGAEQRRIVLLALARVGAGLEVLIGDDLRAEFLRRAGEGCGHRGVGGRGAFEHQKAAPFARDDELREPVHELGAARKTWTKSGAHRSGDESSRSRDVEQKSVAATHGFGERLEALRRRVDQEEMVPASSAARTAGATSAADFTVIRCKRKSAFSTRASGPASSRPTSARQKGACGS